MHNAVADREGEREGQARQTEMTHLAPKADAGRVVVAVEPLPEAVERHEVGRAELEVLLSDENLEALGRPGRGGGSGGGANGGAR